MKKICKNCIYFNDEIYDPILIRSGEYCAIREIEVNHNDCACWEYEACDEDLEK